MDAERDPWKVIELPRSREAARVARGHVRAFFEELNAAADVVDKALMVVTELVTNALIHGRGRLQLHLGTIEDFGYIAVSDRAPDRLPVVDLAPHQRLSGRGLALVAAFSERWGTDVLRHPNGCGAPSACASGGADRCYWPAAGLAVGDLVVQLGVVGGHAEV